ncbi:DUF402 domain-containing protein [Paenibacillus sp. P25]|nr:DUF402 domain-containing protein [Paenibacillus sp. P25]
MSFFRSIPGLRSAPIWRTGEIRQYYCNINEPAVLKDSLVSFVDLDLDLVYRGGEWKVVDEDEFEANRVKFRYPDELAKRARLELERLQLRVKEGRFPFDGTLNRFMPLMDGEGR